MSQGTMLSRRIPTHHSTGRTKGLLPSSSGCQLARTFLLTIGVYAFALTCSPTLLEVTIMLFLQRWPSPKHQVGEVTLTLQTLLPSHQCPWDAGTIHLLRMSSCKSHFFPLIKKTTVPSSLQGAHAFGLQGSAPPLPSKFPLWAFAASSHSFWYYALDS